MRQMTSMSAWIPAILAGMTHWSRCGSLLTIFFRRVRSISIINRYSAMNWLFVFVPIAAALELSFGRAELGAMFLAILIGAMVSGRRTIELVQGCPTHHRLRHSRIPILLHA
jgi:hypothetical protein